MADQVKAVPDSVESFDSLPNDAHISARAVALVAGVSEATVWRLARRGKLTPKKIGERSTRFRVGEVRDLIAA